MLPKIHTHRQYIFRQAVPLLTTTGFSGPRIVLLQNRMENIFDLTGKTPLIEVSGGTALAVEMHITDPAQVKVGVGPRGRTLDLTQNQWTTVIDSNLNGVFYTVQEAVKQVIATGIREHIDTASLFALRIRSGLRGIKGHLGTFDKDSGAGIRGI